MSLKKSVFMGVKWSTASQIGRQGMQIVTMIILARLLSPIDFGLVSMATVVIGFIAIFKDLGTASALIQRKHISDELLYSIFWLNAMFGLLATAILLGSAPLIGRIYHEPRVTPILGTLSLTFFIAGLSTLQQTVLERNLEFGKLAKIELGVTLLSSIIGVISALFQAGAWSLVYQTLVSVSATTILLWFVTGWQPKIIFDWNELKSITSYSLNLTGFSIFNYFARNADYFLIGRFLGVQSLGYYTLAYRIMLYPLQNIVWVIGRVIFPAFSQMQHDNTRFCYAYLRVTQTIAFVVFPLMVGLWALAEPFVLATFGASWQPVILLVLILSPIGMIHSIGTTVGDIYQAKGRTDWMLRWGLFAGTLVVCFFCIGLQWGIVGVAGAYAIVSALLIYPSFAIPFKLIGLSMREFLAGLWRPFLCSLLMLAVLAGSRLILPNGLASVWQLGILIPVGCLTYLLSSWLLNREQLQETLSIVGMRN
ncbi:MAG: MOP flippase family protein [Scytolyngbya sp. HA4215-MV1]|jgi:PST family polysaccharide transporter|nr:MOP flippase family protein [Scytolyngbya sp. HA4215-MV1]